MAVVTDSATGEVCGEVEESLRESQSSRVRERVGDLGAWSGNGIEELEIERETMAEMCGPNFRRAGEGMNGEEEAMWFE